jgi:hypothetical protein
VAMRPSGGTARGGVDEEAESVDMAQREYDYEADSATQPFSGMKRNIQISGTQYEHSSSLNYAIQ